MITEAKVTVGRDRLTSPAAQCDLMMVRYTLLLLGTGAAGCQLLSGGADLVTRDATAAAGGSSNSSSSWAQGSGAGQEGGAGGEAPACPDEDAGVVLNSRVFANQDTWNADALASGSDGSLFVGGRFTGGIKVGAFNALTAEGENGFVVKLDADYVPVWQRGIGGTGIERVTAIAARADGGAFVAGTFSTTLTIMGETHASQNGELSGFVIGLDPDGQPEWSLRFDGSAPVDAVAIDADEASVWVAGTFMDGVTIKDAANTAFGTPLDGANLLGGFIAAFAHDGTPTRLVRVGSNNDAPIVPTAVALAGETVVVAGTWSGTFGEAGLGEADFDDGFILFDAAGPNPLGIAIGGPSLERIHDMDVDDTGRVIVAATSTSESVTLDDSGYTLTDDSGDTDGILARYFETGQFDQAVLLLGPGNQSPGTITSAGPDLLFGGLNDGLTTLGESDFVAPRDSNQAIYGLLTDGGESAPELTFAWAGSATGSDGIGGVRGVALDPCSAHVAVDFMGTLTPEGGEDLPGSAAIDHAIVKLVR